MLYTDPSVVIPDDKVFLSSIQYGTELLVLRLQLAETKRLDNSVMLNVAFCHLRLGHPLMVHEAIGEVLKSLEWIRAHVRVKVAFPPKWNQPGQAVEVPIHMKIAGSSFCCLQDKARMRYAQASVALEKYVEAVIDKHSYM